MRYSICLIALLAGCAARYVSIDYAVAPPADWPQLKERVNAVTRADMPKVCSGLGPNPELSRGCAVLKFAEGVCEVYLTEPDNEESLKHERAHCKGYGHVGNPYAPAAAWARYKDTNGL